MEKYQRKYVTFAPPYTLADFIKAGVYAVAPCEKPKPLGGDCSYEDLDAMCDTCKKYYVEAAKLYGADPKDYLADLVAVEKAEKENSMEHAVPSVVKGLKFYGGSDEDEKELVRLAQVPCKNFGTKDCCDSHAIPFKDMCERCAAFYAKIAPHYHVTPQEYIDASAKYKPRKEEVLN